MKTGKSRKLVQIVFTLTSTAIALSACGQLPASTGTSVKGVTSTDLSSVYIPTTAPTGTTTTPTVVSGSTSVNPPTLASGVTNGSSNTLEMATNITFVAPFQADATLTYQWYKNGSALNGATTSEYTLTGIKAADYAIYTVKATNSLGSATSAGFVVQPVTMLATLGSHDCNGYQCWNDPTTADKVCKIRFGEQSVMVNPYAFGPSYVKWTTQFCTWNGTSWNCDSNCTNNCNGYNVLGYVYCYK